jgi:cytochrome c5
MRAVCGIVSAGALYILVATSAVASTQAPQPAKPMARADAAKLKNPVASTPDSIAAGKQLYGKYCRFCHGAEGKGDSPTAPKDIKPADLTDKDWTRGSSDGEIFLVIQEGAGPEFKMKGLKGKLSEEDTWHLVNFVRSLAK